MFDAPFKSSAVTSVRVPSAYWVSLPDPALSFKLPTTPKILTFSLMFSAIRLASPSTTTPVRPRSPESGTIF